jgi:hypothetical protein
VTDTPSPENEASGRPAFASWPEEARVEAIKAVDWRSRNSGLRLTASDAWYLVSDILNAAAPFLTAPDQETIAALKIAVKRAEDIISDRDREIDQLRGQLMALGGMNGG